MNISLYFTDSERNIFISQLAAGESSSHFIFFPVFMIVSALTYHILTLLQFRNHRRNILNNLSYYDEKVNLNWLRNIIIGMTAIWLVVIISLTKVFNTEDDNIIYITVTLFVIAIGYFGVKQGNIFTSPPVIPQKSVGPKQEKRYQKSGLKESSADKLEKKLKELMDNEKLYLDENFSLPKLAEIMDASQNHLSQLINERFKQNFYDFVNAYRVEEFKRLAQDPKKKHLTLLSLAFDAGFNSKSSFNKYFKKMTGQTPSAYVKKIY
jgi:AraC-like DNA-binding protein